MILIITGHLAYPLVKQMAEKSSKETIVHVADTQVAAFLTPSKIIKEIKENFSDILDDIDLILVPGLIRKDTFEIAEALKIPCYKASTDAADLAMVLDLVDDLELSQSTPADRLIIEEKRKQALKIIDDYENDLELREELLKKENNIMVRNLPVGDDYPLRVLSEIASAPVLSKEALIRKAEYFVASGSDMIDIGMIAGEDRSDEIPDLIDVVVENNAGLFSFARYCPTSLEKATQMTPEEYRNLLEKVWKKYNEYKDSKTFFTLKDHLWTLFLYEKGLYEIPENLNDDVVYDGCNCGNSHLTILPSGDVFACRRMDSKVGNALNESIYDIFMGDDMDEYRQFEKFEKCSRCELLRFCRGCPAVSYGTTHDMYSSDPQCWKEVL